MKTILLVLVLVNCDLVYGGEGSYYPGCGGRAWGNEYWGVNAMDIGIRWNDLRGGFGACDYYWSDCSGLRYALYGGWIAINWDRGMSALALDRTPEWVSWAIGACDQYWANLPGLRSVIYGGRCGFGTRCGILVLVIVIDLLVFQVVVFGLVELANTLGGYTHVGRVTITFENTEIFLFLVLGIVIITYRILQSAVSLLFGMLGVDVPYSLEWNGCFAMDDGMPEWCGWTGGACDYYGNDPPGLRSVFCGGRHDIGVRCGWSCFSGYGTPEYALWDVGACDYFWGRKSCYVLVGTRAAMEVGPDAAGMYGCDFEEGHWVADWRFGAWNCDYNWVSDDKYAMLLGGGSLGHSWQCGALVSCFTHGIYEFYWYIGACDTLNLWSDRCYVLVGAKAISGGLVGVFAVSLWYFDATYDVGAR